MGFANALIIFFCSPLYFLLKGKWLAFIFNSIVYVLALVCVVSVIGIIFGVVLWAVAVAHGMWNLRNEMLQNHATDIATKMASAMGQQAPASAKV